MAWQPKKVKLISGEKVDQSPNDTVTGASQGEFDVPPNPLGLGTERDQADQHLLRQPDQKGTTVRESRNPRQISVIGAPTSAGAYGPGQERTPATLRAHGLTEALAGTGRHVTDRGDGPTLTWRNDETNPTANNVDLVATAATFLAEQVATALADGDDILVLGGDCTVMDALVRRSLPQAWPPRLPAQRRPGRCR